MIESALSTVDTRLATLLARRAAMGLPAGDEPAVEPTTTVAALSPASSWAIASSTWVAGSFWPSEGAVSGVTMTASVARSVTAGVIVM